MIHPTALIDPRAQLDPTVSIGPYAIIDGPATLGAGVRVEAHAQIVGHVTIGAGTLVGRAAIIGGEPQDLSFDPACESYVVIGESNIIREQVTIHRGSKPGGVTRVGNHNYLMANVHLAHDVVIGNRNIIANAVLFAGHVHMGSYTVIGGQAVFHQFIHIGDYCMIQGKSGFSKDIPPYCLAHSVNCIGGLNIIGMRRAGISTADRASIKELFDLVYRGGLNLTQARAAIAERTWPEPCLRFIDFISNPSRKGIAPHRARGEAEE